MKTVILIVLTLISVGVYQFFRNKSGKLLVKNSDFLEIGRLIFSNHLNEFETFFNLFLTYKKKFLAENKGHLELYSDSEFEKIKPIEVLYIFGDIKNQLYLTDWHGEENEKEIETFIEKRHNQKIDWTNTNKFRSDNSKTNQRDGIFIIDLLKSIDEDLKAVNQTLIFFDLGWDSYVFTSVDQNSYEQIIAKARNSFYSADKLKK